MGECQVNRHGRSSENASDIKTTEQSMNHGTTLSQARGKLKRAQNESGRTPQAVGEYLPPDWVEKLPGKRVGVEDESFVVKENDQGHDAKHEEKGTLGGKAVFCAQNK